MISVVSVSLVVKVFFVGVAVGMFITCGVVVYLDKRK